MEGRFKCNTHRACRGNPGQSSYAFCISNAHGDLQYAEARKIGMKQNIEAEYCYSNGYQILQKD